MEVINQHNEGTFRAALDDCHYFSPWVQESFHVNKKKKGSLLNIYISKTQVHSYRGPIIVGYSQVRKKLHTLFPSEF